MNMFSGYADVLERQLLKSGQPVALAPLAHDPLVAPAARRATRQQARAADPVWPGVRREDPLFMRRLRKALGDTDRPPRHRDGAALGYRFIAAERAGRRLARDRRALVVAVLLARPLTTAVRRLARGTPAITDALIDRSAGDRSPSGRPRPCALAASGADDVAVIGRTLRTDAVGTDVRATPIAFTSVGAAVRSGDGAALWHGEFDDAPASRRPAIADGGLALLLATLRDRSGADAGGVPRAVSRTS
jgi:hypothetical protein